MFGRSSPQRRLDAANAALIKAQRRRITALEEALAIREEMLAHYIGEVHECEIWNALMESPFTQHRTN